MYRSEMKKQTWMLKSARNKLRKAGDGTSRAAADRLISFVPESNTGAYGTKTKKTFYS